MAIIGIEQSENLERVASELSELKGKKGPSQGPVDHFKIKTGERAKEKPKIIKVFQVMGGGKEHDAELVVFDVKKGRVVEEPGKSVKPHPGEVRISLRSGK